MRIFFRSLFIASLFTFLNKGYAQVTDQPLKVYIDCSNTWCDMDFIRTEINIVDFMLDRNAADVHVLITQQSTGGGGDQYQLIFFGQRTFAYLSDTIRFNSASTNTDFEKRDLLVKFLKLGLTPYVIRTNSVKEVNIGMKSTRTNKELQNKAVQNGDPWNYWVFRLDANGNISAEESYKEFRLGGGVSATRVTDDIKLGFEFYGSENKSTYKYTDSTGVRNQVNKQDNYSLNHFLIRSINANWSWGYEASISRSTFSNNKRRMQLRSGIEYNIFPYSQVNTKYFTLAYLLDIRHNRYFDSTLYDKTQETLYGHGLQSKISFNQKWGTIGFGARYHNYFHNWKYLNLGANCEVSIRIIGGLSFSLYTYAELRRDEIYLPKEGATPEEVLTRQKQLATGYYYYSSVGINYRFGSKLNNFVNPRFED